MYLFIVYASFTPSESKINNGRVYLFLFSPISPVTKDCLTISTWWMLTEKAVTTEPDISLLKHTILTSETCGSEKRSSIKTFFFKAKQKEIQFRTKIKNEKKKIISCLRYPHVLLLLRPTVERSISTPLFSGTETLFRLFKETHNNQHQSSNLSDN